VLIHKSSHLSPIVPNWIAGIGSAGTVEAAAGAVEAAAGDVVAAAGAVVAAAGDVVAAAGAVEAAAVARDARISGASVSATVESRRRRAWRRIGRTAVQVSAAVEAVAVDGDGRRRGQDSWPDDSWSDDG